MNVYLEESLSSQIPNQKSLENVLFYLLPIPFFYLYQEEFEDHFSNLPNTKTQENPADHQKSFYSLTQ